MKNKIKFFYILLLFLILSLPITVLAQTFQSNCVVTKIGNGGAPQALPPECTTGELPNADRATLLAQVKGFVEGGKIHFSHNNDQQGMADGSGVVTRMDGSKITIDSQVLRIYVYLVNQGFTFTVSSMVGAHQQGSSSGNQSRHWTGQAADIAVVNGQSINSPSSKQETLKLLTLLNGLIGTDLAPNQVISGGNTPSAGPILDPDLIVRNMNNGVLFSKFDPGLLRNHTDHVHIGY